MNQYILNERTDRRKTFGRTQKIRTKKNFDQKFCTKKFGAVWFSGTTNKKKLCRRRKSWPPAKILVADENLGRRRKSWSPTKISVVGDDDCLSTMTTIVRPRRRRLFFLDDEQMFYGLAAFSVANIPDINSQLFRNVITFLFQFMFDLNFDTV